ncbi:Protein kinase domain-containing protein, partial [Balamuthia mandrillaris]
MLQQVVSHVAGLNNNARTALLATALVAKEGLDAMQTTIANSKAWPDEEVLEKRDQARAKLIEAVQQADEEWKTQDATALQQCYTRLVHQLREVVLQKGSREWKCNEKETETKIEKQQEAETKKEQQKKENEQDDSLLQRGEEALRKFNEWQARQVEQQKQMEEETERQAKRVGEAFQRLASAFSDPTVCTAEGELLQDNHVDALMEAINKEQDFLNCSLNDGPAVRELYHGIEDVIKHLQKVVERMQEEGMMMADLLREKMQVEQVMANPPNHQRLKDLQRANKKALLKIRIAQAEIEAAEDEKEREAAEDTLAKGKKQWKQQVALLEREALQLVKLSNSSCPELRFVLKELGLEAVDLMAVDCPYRRLEHYDHIQVLSSAGRHRVMKAQFQGKDCVLKEFELSFSSDRQHFMRELKRLRALQHEHIVRVEAAFVQEEKGRIQGYIHMPFYSGGNLCEWLMNGRGKDRSEAKKQKVGREVLLALQYIHSQGIVHMDVKPQNIFVEEEGKGMGNDEEENEGNGEQHGRQRAILGDFDISSHAATGTLTMVAGGSGEGGGRSGSEGGGTWAYMAPEVCCGEVGPAADVFSCGLLLFDLHFAVPSLQAQAQAQAQEPRGEGRRE